MYFSHTHTGPSNENCVMICKVECEDDEILCPGGTDPSGCKENDYCHPKGTGNLGTCPGFCPFDCTDDEHKCNVPVDPSTGCPIPALCIPNAKDHNDELCPNQLCPVACDSTEESLCEGGFDHMGCKEQDTCVPICVEACPVTCNEDEIKCDGPADCETGCVEQDVCKSKAKNVNNEACPDDSASHECPIDCCDGTVLCPAEPDVLGCLGPQTCTPTSTGMDNATCPHHTDCPTICEPNEVKCPVTETDDNGCKLPDECILQERDYDGELCTVHCPIDCEDDETYCPGQRNEKGCFEQDQCIKKPIKTKGSDKGGLCPGWCPPICTHGQIKCPSQVDPCDGCPTEEVCVEPAKDLNGEYCPLEPMSASHGCPVICDDLNGETLCPAATNANGCKDAPECIARTKDNDDNWCPAHSVCPSNCGADAIECTYGIDARGCQEAPLCRAKGYDKDGGICPGVCPPTCSNNEILAASGMDTKGCELAATCVEL